MPVDTISGPFCLALTAEYIAHETDTPDAPVPIVTDPFGEQVLLPEDATGTSGSTVCEEGEIVCCKVPQLYLFRNAVETVIGVTQILRDQLGQYPNVQVQYLEDGELRVSVITRITYAGDPPTKIIINHGGPSTGIIKLF